MSGGGSGGSTVVQPSTTTTVQDIPEWEQGYVTDLLGQAQSIAAQPYQQFPGQQIAGFTPDQTQAFSNIEGQQAAINPLQSAATNSATQGAGTANNIYGAGAGDINASTMAASPQGIQAYMSPYLNNQIAGLQTTAQQNWNQFTAPGVNNEFVGNGQSGSGRNEQVLGQQANLANQALTGQIANAEQNAYTTAGNQAATEAGLLGTAGSTLGNLAATQSGVQQNAATNQQNLANSQNSNALTNNQALQASGQIQQQLNQTNLDTAQTNWQNQVNWPASQTEYLNQIIRGLPAPSASTSASQSPAYSVSPLAGVGGGVAGLAGLLGGSSGHKGGGLIRGYKDGGDAHATGKTPETDDEEDSDYGDGTPLDYAQSDAPASIPQDTAPQQMSDDSVPLSAVDDTSGPVSTPLADALAATPAPSGNAAPSAPPSGALSQSQIQQMQLLALARGMLTPQMNGSTMAALGQGIGNIGDVGMEAMKFNAQQNALNYQRQIQQQQMQNQNWEVKNDAFGNLVRVNKVTGETQPLSSMGMGSVTGSGQSPSAPSGMANNAPPAPKGINQAILDSQPAAISELAKSYIYGGEQLPTGTAIKDPVVRQAVTVALQADPSLASTGGRQRAAMQTNANSGKMYTDETNFNSVAGHLYDLHEAAPLTNNKPNSSPALNFVGRNVTSALGLPGTEGISLYGQLKDRAAPELAKFYGGGTSSDTSRAEASSAFNDNLPSDVIQNNAKSQIGLLMSKANTLQTEYNKAMGNAATNQIVHPESQALINDMMGKPLTPQQQIMVNEHRKESGLPPKTWGNSQANSQSQGSVTSQQPSYQDLVAEAKKRGLM